jgi:hypothetical protein
MRRHIRLLVVGFALFFGVPCLSAQENQQPAISRANIVQRAKLTASDAARLDSFGASSAISSDGTTAVVGMASTSLTGAVYVFVKPANGWSNMTQVAKLTASDGSINNYLGYSVAISGDTIVAGAPNAHGYLGAAYVFVKPAGGWTNMTETAELTASDKHGLLGNSVAISGNNVVVGSPNQDQAGAAYVFVKPPSGWASMTQTAKLTPTDRSTYDAFASCVAISGNTAVAGGGKGKVYVFSEPASGWANMTQNVTLIVANGFAGFSVATNGSVVVTGSPYAAIGSNYAQGAAYVFVKPASGWANMSQTATLTASDGAANNWLGYAVSISGNLIGTGAPFAAIGANTTQGAAYTFIKPSTGWQTTSHFNAKIIASDGAKNDDFGWSVSLNGNTLLSGAPGASSQQGAAYIFGQ